MSLARPDQLPPTADTASRDSFDQGLRRLLSIARNSVVASVLKTQCLSVGDYAPDFALANSSGATVTSDSLLDGGPLVLSFQHGNWCPYCTAALLHWRAAAPKILQAGGRIAVINPDSTGQNRQLWHQHGLGFDLLSDVDAHIAHLAGLVLWVAPEAAMTAERHGIRLPVRGPKGGHGLNVAATFVIDCSGLVTFAIVDPDHTQEPDSAIIVAELAGLCPRS